MLSRRNYPAQRVTPWQHNAAMVHLRWWSCRSNALQFRSLHQSSSAGRAPVCLVSLRQYGMTLTANPLHIAKLTASRPVSYERFTARPAATPEAHAH